MARIRRLVRKNILKVKPYIPGKPIEEVKRELGLRNVIKLASNENLLSPSSKVISAAKRALLSLNRYPDGSCFYLKNKLAAYLGINPENLIIGNGSDEIIVLALRAFIKEGDEVIIAKPTFLVYEIASQISGAKIKFTPLRNFRYDIPEIAASISRKTKFIFIANPDNPTGSYVTEKEIDLLMSRVRKNMIVYFDEAYFEFAKDLDDYPNTFKYLFAKGRKTKNVIITRSFSKIHSLAGLRIGYGISNKEIIGFLDRVREPFNVNSMAQIAALAALDDKNHVEKSISLVKKGKSYLYKELQSLKLSFVPSATNFLLVNLGRDSKKVFKKLLKRGIIVREMSPWKLNNFIRVTIGTMRENRIFIRALKEVLRK